MIRLAVRSLRDLVLAFAPIALAIKVCNILIKDKNGQVVQDDT